MKLKRTKLAALALSALMAVSATSLAAYASDDAPATVDSGSDDGTTYTVLDEDSIEVSLVDGEYIVKYTMYSEDLTKDAQYTATDVTYTETAATCTKAGSYKLTATINGTTKDLTSWIGDGVIAMLDHTWVKDDSQTYTDPDALCTSSGTAYYTYVCSVCGATQVRTEELEAQGHLWSTSGTIYAAADGNIVVDTSSAITVNYLDGEELTTPLTLYKATLSDGEVQLKSSVKSGTYYTVYQCTRNACSEYNAIKGTVGASGSAYVIVISSSKIATTDTIYLEATADEEDKFHYSTDLSDLPENDEIELADCDVAGSYTIQFCDSDGNSMGIYTIDVTAHHMITKVIVFASSADYNRCKVTKVDGETQVDDDGYPLFTNTSCYLNSYYYEVELCSAAGCQEDAFTSQSLTIGGDDYSSSTSYTVVNTSDKLTAKPEGDHVALADAKSKIAAASGTLTYEELYDWIQSETTVTDDITVYNWKDFVVLGEDTSTCTSDGTIEVTYICIVDNVNVAETQTVTVLKKGHNVQKVVEEYQAPTCEEDGYFVTVERCVNDGCDYVVTEATTTTLQRLAHTNELTANDGIHPASGDSSDTTNETKSTVYLSLEGTKIVDDDAALLTLYNNGGTLTSSNLVTLTKYQTNLIGGTSDPTLGVTVKVYTTCETCGGNVTELEGDVYNTSSGLTVTIDDIEAQDSNGAGGYIVLTASYSTSNGTVIPVTGTFNYYTSELAYAGRVDKDTAYDPDVTTKNGVYLEDGVYKYYVSDSWATSFNGIIEYNDGYYFVANGVLCTDANGLNLYNGTWYMLAYGKIQSQYTGVTIYDGETFYITNGILDTSVTGLVTYDGAQFLFCYGRLMSEVNGLWFYDSAIGGDDTFYFLAGGQVVDYTGAVIYDGTFFLVENGKLSDYTGTYVYDGATFNVVNGQFYDQVA